MIFQCVFILCCDAEPQRVSSWCDKPIVEGRIYVFMNHSKSTKSWRAPTDHHTIGVMFAWFSFMKWCVTFTPDVTTHALQIVPLLFCQSTEYSPRHTGSSRCFAKVRQTFMLYFSGVVCTLELIFAQALPRCWVMNTDLNWSGRGQLWILSYSFATFFLDESFICSFRVISVGWATPGKVQHCSMISPFVDNGCHHDSLQS